MHRSSSRPPSPPAKPGPLLRLGLYGGSFVLGLLTAWASTVALEGVGLLGRRRAAPPDDPDAAPPASAARVIPDPEVEITIDPPPAPGGAAPGPQPGASADRAGDEAPSPGKAGLPLNACVQSAFAADTFPEGWVGNFHFLCEEADPRGAAHLLRSELIRAGNKRHITPGMREWSTLGWHNMAVFAAIRGHCCPAPAPPLRVPTVGACSDLSRPLNDLMGLAAGHHPRDPQRLQEIRESYRAAVQCLDRAGSQGYYDQWGALRGSEDATFDAMLGRILDGAPSSPSSPASAAPPASTAPPAAASPPSAPQAAPSPADPTAPPTAAPPPTAPPKPATPAPIATE